MTTLADLRRLLDDLPGPNGAAAAAAAAREAQLTKPAGALGRLEALTAWLAAWQGRHPPELSRVRLAVFAGRHGVCARGVSAYPAEVMDQMVRNFAAGGAAINQLCRLAGAELVVEQAGGETATADFVTAAAMGEAACVQAIALGRAVVTDDLSLLALGEMGIGNTTAAAALATALLGGRAEDWCGPGTGLDAAGVARKARVVAEAVAHHRQALDDPLEALRRLGGFELAAIAGAVLEARRRRVPVLLDGFVVTAAAAVLWRLRGDALAHCQAAHCSAEPGHRRLLARLGLEPVLDLRMRLGEGSGAALAIPILRAALACHTGMATFAAAGVSGAAQLEDRATSSEVKSPPATV